MDDFLLRALIGGIGVAILCGPLGCLVIWQRMSYFGATLSHSALLGIGFGLLLQWNISLSILMVSVIVSFLLLSMSRSEQLASDTALGILAHATLSLGILVLTLMPTLRIDLMSYLFGDILTIGRKEIVWIYGGGFGLLLLLSKVWHPLVSLTIQRDLALVDGVNERQTQFIFLLMLSLVVAVSIQVVGALLIVSLLIIPAATARRFANSPEQMAGIASIVGVISVCLGLGASLHIDTPAGPSIVVIASILFALSLLPNKKSKPIKTFTSR